MWFLAQTPEVLETSDVCPENLLNRLIIHQWQRFFVSYTKAINKSHNRTGNLFRQKFKRSAFDPELKFQHLQYYIHHNARKHGVVSNFLDYEHTSYHEIINEDDWLIDIPKSLEWYTDLQDFISFHQTSHYQEVFESIDLDGFIT